MESRTHDLETVSRLRSARIAAVKRASSGDLQMLHRYNDGSVESQVYVVKLLDVFPGLGKVAGRRLMADLGIAPLTRVADLTSVQVGTLLSAVEVNHG